MGVVAGGVSLAVIIAVTVEGLLAALALGGVVYSMIALLGARDFVRALNSKVPKAGTPRLESGGTEPAPGVSILKPLHGVVPRMYAGLESHCRQQYPGPFEIVFGVSDLADPAIAEIDRLRRQFPAVEIRTVWCPERLGASGKVSNLVQMLRVAAYEHVVINDSDIEVSPRYLTNVMDRFRDPSVGLVTAPYIGATPEPVTAAGMDKARAVLGHAPANPPAKGLTLWAKLEALGIATEFMPGVLAARRLEGGIRFGLGSTLAATRTAIAKIGGLETLVDTLADDYQLGHRISQAGLRVGLCGEVVKTAVPAYNFKGFWDHQVRWARTTRDSRKWGYFGMGITYCVPWALAAILASGFALWSFTLLSVALLARVTVALTVGVGVLRDPRVLRDLWLLPLRDCFGMLFWAWSFAGDTVVWSGERFRLKDGKIAKI